MKNRIINWLKSNRFISFFLCEKEEIKALPRETSPEYAEFSFELDQANVSLLELYAEWDCCPCAFSSLDDKGQLYYCHWVASEDGSDSWSYTKVSKEMLCQLEVGNLTIREVLLSNSGGTYIVTFHWRVGDMIRTIRKVHTLREEMLPAVGAKLKVKETTRS